MTVLFNIEDMRQLKRSFPDWVIVAGDKNKNPESLGKGWKKQTQTIEEFEDLINYCQDSETEFWNYGIVTGLHNVCSIDFDWEFVYGLWVQKFGDRANTLTYRTPNLGYRVLFHSTEKDNSNPYKVPLHTEFLNNSYAALGGYAIDVEGNKGSYCLVKNIPLLEDNTLGADTRKFLAEILEKYDFLQYQCINQTVNTKHIKLEHNQRLSLLAFMFSKNFDDAEVHNFFKSVYDANGRDYDYAKTQAQIEAEKIYKEKGGKPHPCIPKEYEDGRRSIALYDVFISDPKTVCLRCKRQRKPEKTTIVYDAEELKALEQDLTELSKNPNIEEFLMAQVHQTVSKFDDHIIRVVFHVGLSTYLQPLNLGLKGESGGGKSYGTTETIKFLPPEDVQFLGSQSPKVISHEQGIRKSQDGEILDESEIPQKPSKNFYKGDKDGYQQAYTDYLAAKQEWKEKLDHSFYEVDLRNKITIFLESINVDTFRMFKATMSRDNPWIDHKYVDDQSKVHITRLIGASALIFNSVDNELVEEFATRNLTATPSSRAEKIEDSMEISNKKTSYPWIYDKEEFNKRLIQEYIRKIKFYVEKEKIKVVNPFDGISEAFSKDAVRDMRDFNKFLELMPSYALFKLFQRPIMTIEGMKYLIPMIQDAIDAKAVFDSIIETTKTGSDARILEFYHKVVADKVNGSTAEILTDQYNKDRKHPISVKRARAILERLVEIGWVDVREGQDRNEKGWVDRRYNNYFPLKKNAPNALIPETSAVLKSILEKSFNKWLENVPIETGTPQKIIILNIDGTAAEITLEEMKALIFQQSPPPLRAGTLFKPEMNPESEKKAESVLIVEKSALGAISEEKLLPSEDGTDGIKQEGEPYFKECYFCAKPIYEIDAIFSDFTKNKPSHKKCFDDAKAQLKRAS